MAKWYLENGIKTPVEENRYTIYNQNQLAVSINLLS